MGGELRGLGVRVKVGGERRSGVRGGSGRSIERTIEPSSERSSDRARERSRTGHNPGSRWSFETLTSSLRSIFQN